MMGWSVFRIVGEEDEGFEAVRCGLRPLLRDLVEGWIFWTEGWILCLVLCFYGLSVLGKS